MKAIVLAIFFTLALSSWSEAQSIKVFHENKNRGFVLYASNPELYPVSLSLNLNLTNLVFSEGEKKVFVVPPKNEKFHLGELTVAQNGSTRFRYDYKVAMGDVTLKNYDISFAYDLPFQKGKSFNLFQGYKGTFSHRNDNALDFTMPEGTEVLAAREGIVVKVVQSNTESCPREECQKYNNYILVMHPDGTFANYAHIKYNGAMFKLGETVKRGDVIAYSGNVGWSSAPHLHFVCFLGGFDGWQTIETKFRIDKGDRVTQLQEGNNYLREY